MAKKTKGFRKQEKDILDYLFMSRIERSINDVASGTQLSWITAEKYLERLEKKGYVVKSIKRIYSEKKKKQITKSFYQFNYIKYYQMKKLIK